MYKTFLIARREYLAFVRTVGFWLSLVTLPLFIIGVGAVPVFLERSAPPQIINVAVLDLSGDHLAGALGQLIAKASKPTHDSRDIIHQVPLPAGLSETMSVTAAETRVPGVLNDSVSNVLLAYEEGGVLHFHIWSTTGQKHALQDRIGDDLNQMQFDKVATANNVDPKVALALHEAKADIVSLTPVSGGHMRDDVAATVRENAPRFIGIAMGYAAWMAIFSSSMILLGSVIEEKASKVLEVLLASASTESLLIGKVLGVAMVTLSVWTIWGLAAFGAYTYGVSLMPHDTMVAISAALSGVLTPVHIALLLLYFVCGYMMFGVTFAAIGSFCETPKDAQAIMGPMMIVLMVPMLSMQAAFVSPDIPIIRYLSYFPLFTPFLMPLRLAQPLPWYEIAGTLLGMGIIGVVMVSIGGRAFKQGAMSGANKLTWGTLFKVATNRV